MTLLKEKLRDWTDLDIAMHELAIQVGMVDDRKGSFAKEYKWIYWSKNKYASALTEVLMKMVEVGVLEYDDDQVKIRVNQHFDINK